MPAAPSPSRGPVSCPDMPCSKATPTADVLINGVRLGAEPTPLLHGDKVEVGDHELTFVDERRSGSTQFVQALSLPQGAGAGAGGVGPVSGGAGGAVQPQPGAKAAAIGTSGGRVVSLTDGREYVITGTSLVFGREAGCDVVVAGKDVSRRHAEIVQTPRGYLLVDTSTNGTFVNEERVEGQRILARTDVIRLGDEQFRFYADAAPATAAPPPPPGPAASPPQAAPPPSAPSPGTQPVGGSGQAAPAPGAGDRLRHTVHGLEAYVPPSPRSATGGALASFLVRSGGLAGQRLSVKTPVVNIGRADYNDLVVPDPSVSTSHAKLQRREGVWVLVDLDSTNGTFVDGEQVKGEAPLAPGATVRLGDVQLVFEPSDDALSIAKGGGTQMLRTPHSTALNAPPRPASPPSQPPASPISRPSPAPPASPAPGAKAAPPLRPQPPTPSRPGPRPKRPAAQQLPPKQGKGCGGSAAALVVGGGALVALLHRLLA